jgi:AcrR family transcriptional regulator
LGTGANTKERILEAGLEVFANFGYEGARMEKIASLVGINKASLYFHFKSKEELFHELFINIINKYSFATKKIITDTAVLSTKQRLTTIYEKYLEYNWNNRTEMDFWNRVYYYPPVMMKEEIFFQTNETKKQFLAGLISVFEEGIRNDVIQSLNPEVMAKSYYYILICIDMSVDIINKEDGLNDMKNSFELLWKGMIK